jgi:drug/metabolite transporter (DMT)-like permease
MIDYLMAMGSVALIALGFIIQKVYQRATDSSAKSSSAYSLISAALSLLFLIIMNGLTLEITAYSAINATLRALCGLAYTVIGFKIMKEGSVAYYMLFLMSGGMLLPAIYGWIFLRESVLPLHLIGVLIILFALVLSNLGEEKPRPKVILMCLMVFVLNGFVSIFSKLHQVCTDYEIVSTAAYAALGTLASLITSFGLLVFSNLKNSKKDNEGLQNSRFNYKALLMIPIASVIGVISSLMQLECAKTLPASMLYPIITGGTVGLTGIFAAVLFKEKLSKRGLVGVILCVLGTVFFI